MKYKIFILTTVFILIFSFTGCGNNNNDNSNNKKTDSRTSSGSVSSSEDNFEWKENIIVGLSDQGAKEASLVIPSRCEGFNGMIFRDKKNSVKEISFESDKDLDLFCVFSSSDLKKVTLPAQLAEIREKDFWWCSSLQTISIPANVTNIKGYAFQSSTSLETVTFEGSQVLNIASHAFDGCESLKNIELPESITTIDDYAFYECVALDSITLPKSLNEIGDFAFANSGLTDIFIPEDMILSSYKTTSFVQSDHTVVVHVYKNSWADQNFDAIFNGAFEKEYITGE